MQIGRQRQSEAERRETEAGRQAEKSRRTDPRQVVCSAESNTNRRQ